MNENNRWQQMLAAILESRDKAAIEIIQQNILAWYNTLPKPTPSPISAPRDPAVGEVIPPRAPRKRPMQYYGIGRKGRDDE